MTPADVLKAIWAAKWLILFGVLVLAVGVQSYRLQGRTAERDQLTLEKTERARRDAMRDATNLRNKERTDDETTAARKRAAAVLVRGEPGKGVVRGQGLKLAAGGDAATVCFDRGRLDAELAGWLERDSARINATLAALSRFGDDRFTPVARAGEDLAASYRGCRVYTLNRE